MTVHLCMFLSGIARRDDYRAVERRCSGLEAPRRCGGPAGWSYGCDIAMLCATDKSARAFCICPPSTLSGILQTFLLSAGLSYTAAGQHASPLSVPCRISLHPALCIVHPAVPCLSACSIAIHFLEFPSHLDDQPYTHILPLSLLLLELEGDTSDGTLLNALHEVSGETGDLVPQALRGDDGDLIADPLVGVEVESEAGVVLFLYHQNHHAPSIYHPAALLRPEHTISTREAYNPQYSSESDRSFPYVVSRLTRLLVRVRTRPIVRCKW